MTMGGVPVSDWLERHRVGPVERLFGDLRRKAEGVARRVEEHPPAIRCWLLSSSRRAKPEGLCLRSIEVIDRKVEVHLLGSTTVRPGRWLVTLDLHGSKPAPVGLDRDERVAREGNLAAEQPGPERTQCTWGGAVKSYGPKARDGHGVDRRSSPLDLLAREDLPRSSTFLRAAPASDPPNEENDRTDDEASKGAQDRGRKPHLNERERRCRCIGPKSHHQPDDSASHACEHRADDDSTRKQRQPRQHGTRNFHESSIAVGSHCTYARIVFCR